VRFRHAAAHACAAGLVALLMSAGTAAAQQPVPRNSAAASLFAGVAGQGATIGGVIHGAALGAGLEFGARHAVAVRAEATGMLFLSGVGADASCIGPDPCPSTSSADVAVIAGLSARMRPASGPLFLLGGADWIYAPRTSDAGAATVTGVNLGAGLSLGHARRHTVEARWHLPRQDRGLMRWLMQLTVHWIR
jgi:hypothetical protein